MAKDDDKINKTSLNKTQSWIAHIDAQQNSRRMNQHNQTDNSSNSDSSFRNANANAFGTCFLSCTRQSKEKTRDQSISPCVPTLLHRKVFLTDAKIQQVWEEKRYTICINIRWYI